MTKKRVIIIGGGISGLAAAHRLHELSLEKHIPLDITLLEAQDRFGGVIESPEINNFLLEAGPDSFITDKPWAVDLCRRLGLEEYLLPTSRDKRRSFIAHQGELKPVPEGFYLFAAPRFQTLLEMPFLSFAGRLRMAAEYFIPPRAGEEDESIAAFIRRRFGQEALDKIVQPMISGIYGGDLEVLSLLATFPRFREMEKKHGSVIRALREKQKNPAQEKASGPRYSLFMSLTGGMETLTRALLEKSPGVLFKKNARVQSVEKNGNWAVHLAGGEILSADILCLAANAYQSAHLLKSLYPDISAALNDIPYGSMTVVNFAFARQQIAHALDGFGFVVPALEKCKIVGCSFLSVKYAGRAPENKVLLRAFVGGIHGKEILSLPDQEIITEALREVSGFLGISGKPAFSFLTRYMRAMPQYVTGHRDKAARLVNMTEKVPDLFLTGNYFSGIGIPDCVHQAENTAAAILAAV